MPSKKFSKHWFPLVVIKGFIGIIFIIAFLFIIAGRTDYWQAWVFGGFSMIGASINIYVFRNKKELGQERIKPGPGVKTWDKYIMAFYSLAYTFILLIGALDTGKYLWSPALPIYFYIISYILHLLSYALSMKCMWVNKWFSSTVRIQKDRGQKVVQTGPYAIIRHPGYVAGIFVGISSAMVLGSLWALIPAGVMALLLILRTYLEDKTLQKELEGYKEYTKKVKYRLVPYLW